jgi:urocanate hydratase
MGIVRHADAGYPRAIEIGRTTFAARGGQIPMLERK